MHCTFRWRVSAEECLEQCARETRIIEDTYVFAFDSRLIKAYSIKLYFLVVGDNLGARGRTVHLIQLGCGRARWQGGPSWRCETARIVGQDYHGQSCSYSILRQHRSYHCTDTAELARLLLFSTVGWTMNVV